MLILSEQDIQQHYTMKDAIADVKQGLVSKHKGAIENPHRTVIEFAKHQASNLYMPSADKEQEIASMKVVTIFPENPKRGKSTTQGVLMLTDATNGDHLCMMNASYLTRLRTGALSGIATEKLARANSQTLGVIGTGAMAFEQVLGVLAVRDIEQIVLYNRTEEKAKAFRNELKVMGVKQSIEVVTSSDEIVAAADIICCATRSKEPVFDGNQLKPGTHINGVGSYLPSMQEVDFTTIEKASKIVVDDLNGVKDEAGELIEADKSGKWSFSDVYAELSDLSETDKVLRENEEEITFFKSVGAAYFDLVTAKGIYKKAKELGIGNDVDV